MNPIVKKLLIVALSVAVLAYTVINYTNGKIEFTGLLIACAIIGWPMINIVSSLIDDLQQK